MGETIPVLPLGTVLYPGLREGHGTGAASVVVDLPHSHALQPELMCSVVPVICQRYPVKSPLRPPVAMTRALKGETP